MRSGVHTIPFVKASACGRVIRIAPANAPAGSRISIGFSVVEHTLPLRELVMQAERFKAGAMEQLSVARFRGAYRLAAQNIERGPIGGVKHRAEPQRNILRERGGAMMSLAHQRLQ